MEAPEVRYAKTVDGVHIAYQVVGDGQTDLVLVGWLTSLDYIWRWPRAATFFHNLATHARLIMLDRRGTGLSDHSTDRARAKELDARMDDIRAVMDAVGSERAVLLGSKTGSRSPPSCSECLAGPWVEREAQRHGYTRFTARAAVPAP